jgi:hypothetical protein
VSVYHHQSALLEKAANLRYNNLSFILQTYVPACSSQQNKESAQFTLWYSALHSTVNPSALRSIITFIPAQALWIKVPLKKEDV